MKNFSFLKRKKMNTNQGKDFFIKKNIKGKNKFCNFELHLKFIQEKITTFSCIEKYELKISIIIKNEKDEEVYNLTYFSLINYIQEGGCDKKINNISASNERIKIIDENSSLSLTKKFILNKNNINSYNKYILNDEKIFNEIKDIFLSIM